MTTCVIIDDEKPCIISLQYKLSENCPDVQIIATCQTAKESMSVLRDLQPDLVFLDIDLPDLDGFKLLEQLEEVNFQVIFTTAYNEFAVKAFKFNAIDYLLKPVDPDELTQAMERFRQRATQDSGIRQLKQLLHNLQPNTREHSRIALPTARGQLFIDIDDIIRLESESNYTRFFLSDKSNIVVSRTLKDYEIMLSGHHFVRVHNSSIINLVHVKEYYKGKGGSIIMNDGMEIEVSVRRKQFLLEKLSYFLKG
jgi:two-component system, LytTR family, response regulator